MFTLSEIIKATGGRCLNAPPLAKVEGISTDSRTIEKGAIFIAISGERYDGHDFIAAALKKGASGVIIASNKIDYAEKRFGFNFKSAESIIFIAVENTLTALGGLARFHRERFDIPAIAVTGSNGKTTTKEMIYTALKTRWRPLKNSGTENNLIGVPLTLLRLQDIHDSLVTELGMNRSGEIKRLAEISRPNIGVITNIGPSHLQYLGNLKGVYAAKKELLDFLKKGNTAILNGDDSILNSFKRKDLKTLRFGINGDLDFRAESIKRKNFGWSFSVMGTHFLLRSIAYHDIYNALAAISLGALFGVPLREISCVLRGYVSLDKRMRRSIIEGIEFIDDTYNSNPLSMKSAIAALSDCGAKGDKVLVIGDMLELGGRSAYYHSEIGKLIAGSGIDKFISVGELAHSSFLAAGRSGMRNIWFCRTKEEASVILKKITRPGDVVLVKGSRGMRMEEVIKCFTTSYTH